jgi:hypothetical protein
MNGWRVLDLIFPYIEKLTPAEQAVENQRLERDIAAIEAADYTVNDERALDEAQKVSATEIERVRTAEGKATTYLAVLAALVPVIITLQAANWEKKAGPAPDAARLFVLAVATAYVAAAGYHAFKTLQVAGFQRVGEAEIAAAWRTRQPLRKLTRGTLLATRRSREAVNAKITRIRVTHEHLLRAFGTFILLLLLDPLFYAIGFRSAPQGPPPAEVVVVTRENPALASPNGLAPRAASTPKIRAPQVVPQDSGQPRAASPEDVPRANSASSPTPDCPPDFRDCPKRK